MQQENSEAILVSGSTNKNYFLIYRKLRKWQACQNTFYQTCRRSNL